MANKHIKQIVSYSMVGSIGLAVVANLQGCSPPSSNENQQGSEMSNLQSDLQQQNFFLVIEQTRADPTRYELVERYPTEGETRAVLRDMDGNERVLSNDELQRIAAAEAERFEQGNSGLNQEPSAMGGGLGLGETILAAAAGSLIGGMLANKLAGNANFQRHQQAVARPTASISQPANNQRSTTNRASQQPQRGFGRNSSTSSSSRGSSLFGG